MRTLFISIGILLSFALVGCNNALEVQETNFGLVGEISIQGYVLSNNADSVRIKINNKILEINEDSVFTKSIQNEYEFVNYYDKVIPRNIQVISHLSEEVLEEKEFIYNNAAVSEILDTVSFFYKAPSIFISDVYKDRPGKLTANNYMGYRFRFPNMNYYSKSGYDGTLDAVITTFLGVPLATAENINPETFSAYVEFDTSLAIPPLLNLEIVKHGTAESYLSDGSPIKIVLPVESGKSKLVLLEETVDASGNFTGVSASTDLRNYFNYN